MQFESKTLNMYLANKDLDPQEFENRFFGPKSIIMNSWLFVLKQELDEYFEALSQQPVNDAAQPQGSKRQRKSRDKSTEDETKKELKKAKNRARRLQKKVEQKQEEINAVEHELEENPQDEFLNDKKSKLEQEIDKDTELINEANLEVETLEEKANGESA